VRLSTLQSRREQVTGDERAVQQPDISHAWNEYASITTSTAYGQVYSEWDVPPTPSTNDGQIVYFFNAFGGVLEVYGIEKCTDYPTPDYAGGIGFFNQSVLNDKFIPIAPAWKVTNASSGLTPRCNYGGSVPRQVILTY